MAEGRSREEEKGPKAGYNTHDGPDISAAEFRKRGKQLVEFLSDYIEGRHGPSDSGKVAPGFLFNKMPKEPPRKPQSMARIYMDLKDYILPGIPTKQSSIAPQGGSYASLLGSVLCDGLGCISFTWGECPAATELEMLMMNWLADLVGLPPEFQFFGKGPSASGGGIIQSSTTEALLSVTMAAKQQAMTHFKQMFPGLRDFEITNKLTMYVSELGHPSVERVAEVAGVRVKRLWTDSEGILHSKTLSLVIDADIQKDFLPFLFIGTLGTTACFSIDQLQKMLPAITYEKYKIWFHVEAGRAGNAMICPEFQEYLKGAEDADSFSMAPHRWLPVRADFACLWVKNSNLLSHTFAVENPEGPLYIPHDDKNIMADYREWSLPLTRRFRALKLWMVFKLFGVKGLQQKIRNNVNRAKEVEKYILDAPEFDVMCPTKFASVIFRCKKPNNNQLNKDILRLFQESAHSTTLTLSGFSISCKFWLRFTFSGRVTAVEDVQRAWDAVRRARNDALEMFTYTAGADVPGANDDDTSTDSV